MSAIAALVAKSSLGIFQIAGKRIVRVLQSLDRMGQRSVAVVDVE